MHEVSLVLASVGRKGQPIYTFLLRYWRAIHAEFLTHRMLNKNSASSRAIPVEKMLKMVRESPAGPEHWGQNQKGMQAEQENSELVQVPTPLLGALAQYLEDTSEEQGHLAAWSSYVRDEGGDLLTRDTAWRFSAWLAANMSGAFSQAGYHKQVANRLTEPFQYMTVCVTATDWDNFFELRDHKDAMPEFKNLAHDIKLVMHGARPQLLHPGEWHLPWIQEDEHFYPLDVKIKISTARCASTSYKTVEGEPMSIDRAMSVYEKNMGSKPWHASPTEHQARLGVDGEYHEAFRSPLAAPWLQHRKFIEQGLKIE